MSDDFDPCECIYNYELSMQRLLSMLRQSQAYCNDVYCQSNPPNSDLNLNDNSVSASFLVFFAWILAVAGILAFRGLRRGNSNGFNKPGPARNNDPEPPTIN
ncbi:unnamed protein product [Hydatigera taeniaeformis]|uniref:Small integral membrane protein 14 n=1 Tax=Hydatigena taeniaeformis TaxID=6205 RepID=A0A0R3WJ62_HYDTA|nr:unnamed protein product [Hydatigera taeniaeformis]